MGKGASWWGVDDHGKGPRRSVKHNLSLLSFCFSWTVCLNHLGFWREFVLVFPLSDVGPKMEHGAKTDAVLQKSELP